MLAAWGAAATPAQDSLCKPGEPIVFSCHVGSRTVSLCRPSEAHKALIYRFGTPAHPELVYPNDAGAKARFRVSTAPLYGGGTTSVVFTRAGHEYRVYSRVGRSAGGASPGGGVPEFEDGVSILRNGRPLKQLVCDDGGEGFRENIDWLPSGRSR